MEFKSENQGGNTFLVWELPEHVEIDEMIKGMMENNEIKSLLPFVFNQNNLERCIKYNISSRITLQQYLSRTVKKKNLLRVMQGLANTVIEAEDYMIDPGNLFFDLDYIYVDLHTEQTGMVVLPVIWQHTWDMGEFFRSILLKVKVDTQENTAYVAEILNFLNSGAGFSIVEFKKLLKKLEEGGRTEVKKALMMPKPSVVDSPPKKAPIVEEKPVPEKPISEKPVKDIPQDAKDAEEPISLFYLLQHYNRENAAAYKAQKEAKKENGGKKEKKGKKDKKDKKKDQAAVGFYIPGQDTGGFAIPGQPAPDDLMANRVPSSGSASNHGMSPDISPNGSRGWERNDSPQLAPQDDFGATEYVQENDDTEQTEFMELAGGHKKPLPYLIRRKNRERIPITCESFHLGRDVEFNDYPIVDNKYVGKSHCHIITRNGEYFVVDDNSKNHTRVDGERVPAGEMAKLAHGQTLQLANEEFEFRMF